MSFYSLDVKAPTVLDNWFSRMPSGWRPTTKPLLLIHSREYVFVAETAGCLLCVEPYDQSSEKT